MSGKSIRLVGGVITIVALIPAAGPYYLGIVRDDIHAHSRMGDVGLQIMTVAGLALMLAGLILAIRGSSSRPNGPT